MSEIRIRPARPDEVAAIVDVDTDACALDASVGIVFAFGDDHPYVVAERARWAAAVQRRLVEVAVAVDDAPIGMVVFGLVDGEPYVDQLSVRCAWMRRGIGRRLVRRAIAWAARTGGARLWLTTFDHLPWNRPFYETEGFAVRDEATIGPELRATLQRERAALPLPERRVAMVRAIGPADVDPTMRPGSPPIA
jgi:GNAT superfamily N-acetyltransferase